MRIKFFALLGTLLLSPVYAALAGSIDQLVAFGDSLSDNGNAAAALASQGKTLGNYAVNAVTDGPNTVPATTGPFGLWVDQFSAKLGLADPQPFLVNAPGGLAINPTATNFAFADAMTGHNSSFNPANFLSNTAIPGTADQVGIYNALNHNTASASTLYSFWAGANDLASALQHDPFHVLPDSVAAADNISSNIKTLAAEGAKNFLWFNLPALGDTPDAQASGVAGVFLANLASQAFNAEVQSDTASLIHTFGINIIDVDTYSLLKDMIADPKKYGFTNVTAPAQGQAVNPNEYLFWDGAHPTTAADSYLAQLVQTDVSSQFTAAPEPGTLLFATFGLLALFMGVRLRRAN
jgi:phospholipase/lecithinase/hemolysin